jgi:hypothetical protein
MSFSTLKRGVGGGGAGAGIFVRIGQSMYFYLLMHALSTTIFARIAAMLFSEGNEFMPISSRLTF